MHLNWRPYFPHDLPQYDFKSFTELSGIEIQREQGPGAQVYVDVIGVVVDVPALSSVTTRNDQKGAEMVAWVACVSTKKKI